MTSASRWQSGDELWAGTKSITLESELGEYVRHGSLWTIAEDPHWILKLFDMPFDDLDVLTSAVSDRGLAKMRDHRFLILAPKHVVERLGPDGPEQIGFAVPRLDTESLFGGLDAFMQSGSSRFDHEGALQVARNLVAGVSAIHERGFIVGDLKPQNLYVHHELTPIAFLDVDSFCVLDQSRDTAGALTYSRTAFTEGYRAPEVGVGDTPTIQTDLFALGLVVGELLLLGHHPFKYHQIRGRTDADLQGRIDDDQAWIFNPADYACGDHPGLDSLPSRIGHLMVRSLGPEGNRATADEWYRALADVKSGACLLDPTHRVYSGATCVLCARESLNPTEAPSQAPADSQYDDLTSTGHGNIRHHATRPKVKRNESSTTPPSSAPPPPPEPPSPESPEESKRGRSLVFVALLLMCAAGAAFVIAALANSEDSNTSAFSPPTTIRNASAPVILETNWIDEGEDHDCSDEDFPYPMVLQVLYRDPDGSEIQQATWNQGSEPRSTYGIASPTPGEARITRCWSVADPRIEWNEFRINDGKFSSDPIDVVRTPGSGSDLLPLLNFNFCTIDSNFDGWKETKLGSSECTLARVYCTVDSDDDGRNDRTALGSSACEPPLDLGSILNRCNHDSDGDGVNDRRLLANGSLSLFRCRGG